MRNASLYALTAEICDKVLIDIRPADAQISKFFRERAYLGSHDRKFISDTLYALIRNKRRLETITEAAHTQLGGAEIKGAIALLGAYLATEVQQRPDDCDTAFAEAAKCEIEVAQKFIATCADVHIVYSDATVTQQLALKYSYPDWLVERMLAERGQEETELLCAAMNTQAPITLRVNTLITNVDTCSAELQTERIPSTRGAISPVALRLQKRVNIFQSPVFKKGWFEMQDEGSQAIGLFTDPHPNWKILDACAGAGGKTLHLAAMMANKGEIFALVQNEFQEAELRRRLRRAGAQNVRVIQGANKDAIAKFAGTMNVVLIDAPCSGTGTLRRNPVAKWRLTDDKIATYAAAQKEILEQYKHAVKPNGKIVYATCSILKEENADVAHAFLQANPEFAIDTRGTRFKLASDGSNPTNPTNPTNSTNPITPEGFFELLPHRHDTDGFFAAAFTRTA